MEEKASQQKGQEDGAGRTGPAERAVKNVAAQRGEEERETSSTTEDAGYHLAEFRASWAALIDATFPDPTRYSEKSLPPPANGQQEEQQAPNSEISLGIHAQRILDALFILRSAEVPLSFLLLHSHIHVFNEMLSATAKVALLLFSRKQSEPTEAGLESCEEHCTPLKQSVLQVWTQPAMLQSVGHATALIAGWASRAADHYQNKFVQRSEFFSMFPKIVASLETMVKLRDVLPWPHAPLSSYLSATPGVAAATQSYDSPAWESWSEVYLWGSWICVHASPFLVPKTPMSERCLLVLEESLGLCPPCCDSRWGLEYEISGHLNLSFSKGRVRGADLPKYQIAVAVVLHEQPVPRVVRVARELLKLWQLPCSKRGVVTHTATWTSPSLSLTSSLLRFFSIVTNSFLGRSASVSAEHWVKAALRLLHLSLSGGLSRVSTQAGSEPSTCLLAPVFASCGIGQALRTQKLKQGSTKQDKRKPFESSKTPEHDGFKSGQSDKSDLSQLQSAVDLSTSRLLARCLHCSTPLHPPSPPSNSSSENAQLAPDNIWEWRRQATARCRSAVWSVQLGVVCAHAGIASLQEITSPAASAAIVSAMWGTVDFWLDSSWLVKPLVGASSQSELASWQQEAEAAHQKWMGSEQVALLPFMLREACNFLRTRELPNAVDSVLYGIWLRARHLFGAWRWYEAVFSANFTFYSVSRRGQKRKTKFLNRKLLSQTHTLVFLSVSSALSNLTDSPSLIPSKRLSFIADIQAYIEFAKVDFKANRSLLKRILRLDLESPRDDADPSGSRPRATFEEFAFNLLDLLPVNRPETPASPSFPADYTPSFGPALSFEIPRDTLQLLHKKERPLRGLYLSRYPKAFFLKTQNSLQAERHFFCLGLLQTWLSASSISAIRNAVLPFA